MRRIHFCHHTSWANPMRADGCMQILLWHPFKSYTHTHTAVCVHRSILCLTPHVQRMHTLSMRAAPTLLREWTDAFFAISSLVMPTRLYRAAQCRGWSPICTVLHTECRSASWETNRPWCEHSLCHHLYIAAVKVHSRCWFTREKESWLCILHLQGWHK